MSLLFSFMVLLFDDSNVLVETEDGTGKEERLGHVVEQAGGHVVDVDDLIGNERDAAGDEQHRTDVLRNFEFCIFHAIKLLWFFCYKDTKKNWNMQTFMYFLFCVISLSFWYFCI